MKGTKRANTYIERMGFKDNDIKNLNHDNICLSFCNFGFLMRVLNENGLGYVKQRSDEEVKKDEQIVWPRIKPNFEVMLQSKSGYNLGFIDITLKTNDYNGFYIKEMKSRILYSRLVIEVKSKMPTFGEIMREMNYYKSNFSSIGNLIETLFCVCSPEIPYIEELKEQNVIPLQIILGDITKNKNKEDKTPW